MSRAARAYVQEVERVSPVVKKPNGLALAHTRGLAEQGDKRRIQLRDVAALDAMCRTVEQGGQRPLKPPPLANLPSRVSAGALALHRDKKLGVYSDPRVLSRKP